MFRPYLLAAAAILPSLVACGGDDGAIVPEGEHYHYVVNQVLVPSTSTQTKEFGLDLNGDKVVDNTLGSVLSTLKSMGLDAQAALDKAVATGQIALLVDFQTKDFTSSSAAGIQVFLGDNTMITPPACNTGEMYDETAKTGCKHHLDGNGSFVIASGSPSDAALGGKIAGGTFTGGPGTVHLQIALGGTGAIDLDLIGARAKASGISDMAIGSSTSGGIIIGGAITKDDVDTKIIPQIRNQLAPYITEQCTMLSSPPGCGCPSSSTASNILSLFDKSPQDCMITDDEIRNNNIVMTLLAPDVTIDGKMALSLGIKATAIKATYTAPNQ